MHWSGSAISYIYVYVYKITKNHSKGEFYVWDFYVLIVFYEQQTHTNLEELKLTQVLLFPCFTIHGKQYIFLCIRVSEQLLSRVL